ncbi:MAG: hypothetical protein IPH35_09280 [Rhodoferax sp.]|nr:hypothetical protein [Rhodoferax sp.]
MPTAYLPSTFFQRALERLRLSAPAQPPVPSCGLGIDALPQGVGLLPSGAPVALAWQNRDVDWLWVHGLLDGMLAEGPVFILAEHASWIDQLLQHPPLPQAHAGKQLKLWLLRDGKANAQQSMAMVSILVELEQFGLDQTHALLVVVSPYAVFGPTVAQSWRWALQVANWARRRTRPLVFGFTAYSDVHDVLGPLRNLGSVFEHIAMLNVEAQNTTLYLDRWSTPAGPLFESRYGLEHTSARLAYNGSHARGQTQHLVEAPDQFEVWGTQAAVADQRVPPAAWKIVPQADDLLAATEGSLAATVLLESGPSASLDATLHLVHRLRLVRPRTLKIVVRETHDKLRNNIEQAFLHLGANRVVYREVGFTRLVRLIEDINAQAFTHTVDADFSTALGGFMPDPVRGYLKPEVFCTTVLSMLERTSHMGLNLVCCACSCSPTRAPGCHTRMPGVPRWRRDHCRQQCFVFMFSCAESDVGPVLARLFSLPPTELLAHKRLTIHVRTCAWDCALPGCRTGGLPDYSVHFTTRMTSTATSAAASAHLAPAPAPTQPVLPTHDPASVPVMAELTVKSARLHAALQEQ